MTRSATLAVVGGDIRQAHLAGMLHADGHMVRTFALERHPVEGCAAVSDLRACFAGVQAVILPLPVQHGDAQLNAPLSNAPHPLSDVLDAVPAGTPTLAGAVPFWVHARAVQNDLHLIDYLSRDELAIRNAVPVSLAKSTVFRWERRKKGLAFASPLLSAGFSHAACGRSCPPPDRFSGC